MYALLAVLGTTELNYFMCQTVKQFQNSISNSWQHIIVQKESYCFLLKSTSQFENNYEKRDSHYKL